MKQLALTTQQTNAKPEAIFALWEDVDNWATNFDDGIEWAKLNDVFKPGGEYVIKPKGGPKTKATILIVEPNQRFLDVSHLPGAKLKFDHTITQEAGLTTVKVAMTISGPLSVLWAKILGKNQQAGLDKSVSKLIAKAKQKS